jgi:hypothetical protein
MRIITVLCCLLTVSVISMRAYGSAADDRLVKLDSLLTQKAVEIPALQEKVSISVSGVTLELPIARD